MLAVYVLSQHRAPSEIQTCNGVVTHTQDGKRQLLTLFCPVLPAKVPFQNHSAAALFDLIVTTS